ncbi:MAG TPA: branched-chain amino acid ABC transporter permease [Gaiellaceae bacterium]|nr:branched-chain amino acid ABC transporter permease [Gaiellaceae bacterium]
MAIANPTHGQSRLVERVVDMRRLVLGAGTRRAQAGRLLLLAVLVLALMWILLFAEPPSASGVSTWRTTTFGSAVHDPTDFVKTTLDSLTYAGLLFVVASGFTLIFGLMRVVNMAHGSFFLLAGYIAVRLQKSYAHAGIFGLTSDQVSFLKDWLLPLVIATAVVAGIGLITQQLLLRWNQGQELRQALITVALSLIIGDQILAHFVRGGAEGITWPRQLGPDKQLHLGSIDYPWSRIFMLLVAIGIGLGLLLWLKETKTGIIIRAGVDDRHMVRALGIPIERVFAIAFLVGIALAAFGGVIGGSFSAVSPGLDGNWLLNSLVVVIIGGMGSLGGAAVGALAYGALSNFAAVYLPTTSPNCCTQYSIILTFALLTIVLAIRPYGLFGKPA